MTKTNRDFANLHIVDRYRPRKCGCTAAGKETDPTAPQCRSYFPMTSCSDARKHFRQVHFREDQRVSGEKVPCPWQGCKELISYGEAARHYDEHMGLEYRCPFYKECKDGVSLCRSDVFTKHWLRCKTVKRLVKEGRSIVDIEASFYPSKLM